jgi:hypothetical protein
MGPDSLLQESFTLLLLATSLFKQLLLALQHRNSGSVPEQSLWDVGGPSGTSAGISPPHFNFILQIFIL